MKKSVILIIAIVYFASVLIVGLMGLEMRIYNQIVYIEQINYRVEGKKADEQNDNFRISYEKTPDGGYTKEYVYTKTVENYEKGDVLIRERYTENLTIELKFDVVPANATETALAYTIPQKDIYKVNDGVETGWIVLTKNADGNAELAIKKTDEARSKATSVIVKPANSNHTQRVVNIEIYF